MGLLVCCPVFPKGQESERHLPEQATQEEGTIKTCSLWQTGRGGVSPSTQEHHGESQDSPWLIVYMATAFPSLF